MRNRDLFRLITFGFKSVITRSKRPILGTIIVTDYCNLNCKHCSVNNINQKMYAYIDIENEMLKFYKEGIRILFLSGGETLLWAHEDKNIYDLINKAREIGFFLINIVTNGTINLNIPEVDLIFLSLDGTKDVHNSIRGETFDLIESNLDKATVNNISVFMAINRLNVSEVNKLTIYAKEHPKLNGISFNFHTPYRVADELCLDMEQRIYTVKNISNLIEQGYPVFNLKSTLKSFLINNWKRPCYQCIVSEDNKRFICGRCSEIPGLCDNCGYLFALEFSKIFSGNIPAIIEMLKTYTRFV
ncbi:MAG: radical SAM protein [Spirochaetaceae bacterium]